MLWDRVGLRFVRGSAFVVEFCAEFFVGERAHDIGDDLSYGRRWLLGACSLARGFLAALLRFSLNHNSACAGWREMQYVG